MSYFNRRKKLLNENLARAQQSERLGEALGLEQRVINRRLSHKAATRGLLRLARCRRQGACQRGRRALIDVGIFIRFFNIVGVGREAPACNAEIAATLRDALA